MAKKGIGSINSNVWRSNFPKDVIKISFEDYCGSLFNRVCKISQKKVIIIILIIYAQHKTKDSKNVTFYDKKL